MRDLDTPKHYRTLFISDIHLGTKACQAELVLDFLKHNDADTYYLVGDIVDFWRVKRGAYWPQSHNDVIQKLLRKVRKGTRIIYVPGNHDDSLRGFCGTHFGGIEVARNWLHETADGRSFLVLHGDEFDIVVRYAKWLAFAGDWAYGLALRLNTNINWIRRRLDLPYWSLSSYLKHKVKRAVNYIGEFETAIIEHASRHNAEGVICGHIHHAAIGSLAKEIGALGGQIQFLTPQDFRTIPCPTYPEIRLAIGTSRTAGRRVEAANPDYIHIATEGPIGLMTRSYCRKARLPFTTSYHTRFPEYIAARFPIRESLCYAYKRRFHNSGDGMMVASQSLAEVLKSRGFKNILNWSRGVDTELFRPREVSLFGDRQPVFLYVGRVSVEKNIEAFLRLDLPGRKVVVGAGPQLERLKAAYPDVQFTGPKYGEDLARCYASSDAFVFPSLTDTFGLVLLEAMASGLPIAAYPVTGPMDVLGGTDVGVIDDDLRKAALAALKLDPNRCREHALKYSWARSARQFVDNIAKAHRVPLQKAA